MRKLLLLVFIVNTAFALNGGVYSKCHGDQWALSADGMKPGKTCIHCNDGEQIKLYVKRKNNNKLAYYRIDWSLVVVGDARDAIQKLCR